MINNYFKNWLIWNVGGGAAAIAVIGVILLLLGSDISSRAMEIESQRQNLESRLQAIDSLISLREGSVRSKDLLPKLQNSLPSQDQLIGFSKFMEAMAQTNSLSFNFAFLDEIAGTDSVPSTNNFILTLSGPYADFLKFLQSVEASQYYISFTSFEVVAKGPVFEVVAKGKVFAQ